MSFPIRFVPFALLTALPAWAAGLYGDVPDARHAWAVHDWNRPVPAKVTTLPGQPPSDAVVLLDGTSLDNWVKADKNSSPAHWKLADGAMEVASGGYLRTKQAFGDCQLHLEWRAPQVIKGDGQGRGNSGVFLMGRYEVQVLDSAESVTYADGQASAIYGQNPPLVNACRPASEWQTYDIVFHQPRWQDGKLVFAGSVTVLHNGVLTQDNWEYDGGTSHMHRSPLTPHPEKLPLELQDHNNPVQFRNIWIREIPSRLDNTTHGTPWTVKADVMKLRAETAARLYEKNVAPLLEKQSLTQPLEALMEVLSYDNKTATYTETFDRLAANAVATMSGWNAETVIENKGAVLSLKRACDVLVRGKVIPADHPLAATTRRLNSEHALDKR